MKKTIFTLSALTLAFALTGCNDSKESAQIETQPQPEAAVTTQSAAPADNTDGIEKIPAPIDDSAASVNDAVDNAQNQVQSAIDQAADDANKLPATATGSASDSTVDSKADMQGK